MVALLSLFPFFPEDKVGQPKCALSVLNEVSLLPLWRCGRQTSDSRDPEEGWAQRGAGLSGERTVETVHAGIT